MERYIAQLSPLLGSGMLNIKADFKRGNITDPVDRVGVKNMLPLAAFESVSGLVCVESMFESCRTTAVS